MLDIGAGLGAITGHLLKADATVRAVELHPGRAAALRTRFAGCSCLVVEADASCLRLPARRFRVVANPPYAALASILRRLTSPRSQLERADLIVPPYVAARWVHGRAPGGPRIYASFTVHTAARLPRHAFHPASATHAAHLVIVRRWP